MRQTSISRRRFLGSLLALSALPLIPKPIRSLSYNVATGHTPVGYIMAWMEDWVPKGWLPCHGQALDPNQYPELFKVIGNTYGQGEFRLPNVSMRFKLPEHRGMVDAPYITPDYLIKAS